MGAFSDYIAGLEGKADLDILAVVADLSRLHDEEIGGVNDLLSSANAKIETQTVQLTESAQHLAEAQAETSRVKTANYDLLMSQGINQHNDSDSGERVIDDTNITPDDLFEKSTL